MFDVCMPWLMLPVIGLCRMAKVKTRVNFANDQRQLTVLYSTRAIKEGHD